MLSGFLMVLAVTPLIIKGNAGYVICLIICFILGSLNSLSQNSLIALTNLVDGPLIGIFWVGTGVSGLVMNFLRAIALLAFPNTN